MSAAQQPRLLFVDDEREILHGIRNVFHRRGRWRMRFAAGGEEALGLLAQEPADVVITDMRMPGMDGLQLLRHVQQGWPLAARIVLSGFAEGGMVAKAASVAHQYLLKPCDPEVLQGVIERALELQGVLQNQALRRTVGSLGALPSAPRLYHALGTALEDPDVEIGRLAGVVAEDVGMSGRVLQFVNSAYFGLSRKITSIEEAIVLIGIGTLRHLALTLEVFRAFAPTSRSPLPFEALERHSLLTARIARRIIGDAGRSEAAFAAGLLHDSGKLVLLNRLPELFTVALERAAREDRPLCEVERDVLGADHAQVGAYLLGLWGLPHPIVEAVAFHHAEHRLTSGTFDLVAAIGAADSLARASDKESARAEQELARLGRLAEERRGAWIEIAAREAQSLSREPGGER